MKLCFIRDGRKPAGGVIFVDLRLAEKILTPPQAEIKSHFRSASLRLRLWSVYGQIGMGRQLIEGDHRAVTSDDETRRRGGRFIPVTGLKRFLLGLLRRSGVP